MDEPNAEDRAEQILQDLGIPVHTARVKIVARHLAAALAAEREKREQAERERDHYRREIIAGVYDAASVGITLIQTTMLDEIKARAERAEVAERLVGAMRELVSAVPALLTFAVSLHERHRMTAPKTEPAIQRVRDALAAIERAWQ